MGLSEFGLIFGISIVSIVLFALIFGLNIIYQSYKTKARLLTYFGLGLCSFGLTWLGKFCDFLTILATSRNLDNSNGIISTLSVMWIPWACFFSTAVGIE